jgi:hypothetical protein
MYDSPLKGMKSYKSAECLDYLIRFYLKSFMVYINLINQALVNRILKTCELKALNCIILCMCSLTTEI